MPFADKTTKEKKTAVYRHFSNNGTLLYVGVSASVMSRLFDHRDGAHWYDDVTRVDLEWFPNRKAALAAERKAIKEEFPAYNNIMSGNDMTTHAMEYLLELRDDPPPGYEIREDGGLLLPWQKKVMASPEWIAKHGEKP